MPLIGELLREAAEAFDEDRLEDAQHAAEQVIQIDVGCQIAQLRLGMIHAKGGNWDSANAWFRKLADQLV